MKQIMYCATPTRMIERRDEVKELARAKGFAPVFPFDCLAYEDSEGDPEVGRERALVMDIKFQDTCEITGVFGISAGVLGEVNHALHTDQSVRTFPGLDHEWDAYYAKLKDAYGDPLARVRGPHTLTVVAGPRAIGKTFWIELMLSEHRDVLRRVKTCTTRAPREDADYNSYTFLTEAEFQDRLDAREFLEHDTYRGFRYASSLTAIKDVLRESHGIIALTPPGVAAVWELRYEINVRIVRLVPGSDAMVMRNLDRRRITEDEQRRLLVAHAREFDLLPEIPVNRIVLTGDAPIDGPAMHAALAPPA